MIHEIINKIPPIGVIGSSNDKLIPINSCKDNKYIENENNIIPISMNFPIRWVKFSLMAFRPIISSASEWKNWCLTPVSKLFSFSVVNNSLSVWAPNAYSANAKNANIPNVLISLLFIE